MIKPWPIVSLLFQNVFFQCGDYYYNLESFASSSSYREGFICSSLWVDCPQTYILGPASRSLSIYLSGLVTLLRDTLWWVLVVVNSGPLKQIIKITLVPMYLLLRPYNQQNIIIIVTQAALKIWINDFNVNNNWSSPFSIVSWVL